MGFLKSAAAFLLAVFILRAALGAMFQAPGAAGPALVEAFALDWAGFGTIVGLFWFPGLLLAYPLGLVAHRFGDRRGVLLGIASALFLLAGMGWPALARIAAWQAIGVGLLVFAAQRRRTAAATG